MWFDNGIRDRGIAECTAPHLLLHIVRINRFRPLRVTGHTRFAIQSFVGHWSSGISIVAIRAQHYSPFTISRCRNGPTMSMVDGAMENGGICDTPEWIMNFGGHAFFKPIRICLTVSTTVMAFVFWSGFTTGCVSLSPWYEDVLKQITPS